MIRHSIAAMASPFLRIYGCRHATEWRPRVRQISETIHPLFFTIVEKSTSSFLLTDALVVQPQINDMRN